ncbi:hypothetical protein [Bradyrhizobium sp. AUGA SZCCT0182]|uniref:hypothetical protein n=1 Tax=Bradyrhizobium sp. AUGA SZCCT0182 TaxID=2807667 RepID=UPI001BA458B4|nr:hypothetical protein [Bradyrhizobium sp. AUGA SZCCT0182]MBR1232627.1 hypothetical protein [Bradyrhizobium sp. AUGA SZCCT0182]
MKSEPIEADIRATHIWRTAQRRRATYLATLVDEPTDDAGYVMARKLAIPSVLASGVMAVAVWALA